MSASARKARPPTLTTSVKIPPRTKSLVVRAAQDAGMTVHAYLLDVIERATERASQRRELIAEAKASLEEYRRTGIAYRAEDVHAYFQARAAGAKNPPRPKAVKIGKK